MSSSDDNPIMYIIVLIDYSGMIRFCSAAAYVTVDVFVPHIVSVFSKAVIYAHARLSDVTSTIGQRDPTYHFARPLTFVL